VTIQEAIKSGKEFRRKGDSEHLHVGDNGVIEDDFYVAIYATADDILADDWEVKE
jgi:hypothetical protein